MVKVNLAERAQPSVTIKKVLPKFKLTATIGTDIKGLECKQPLILSKTLDLADLFYDMEYDEAVVAALVEDGAVPEDDDHVSEDLLYDMTAANVARAMEIAYLTEDSDVFVIELFLSRAEGFVLLSLDVEDET